MDTIIPLGKYKKPFLILLPFFLVYIGSILTNINAEWSTNFKLMAFFYMLFYVLLKRKGTKNLLGSLLLFLPFYIYAFFVSFNYKAATEDSIRYFFPIVILFYSYNIRGSFNLLVKFVAIFIVINFLIQIVSYVNWLRGIDQWFYHSTPNGFRYYNQTMGVIRASGLVTEFAFYAFMNFIGFLIIQKYYFGKYKNVILTMSILALLGTLSYKTFATALIVFFTYYYKKIPHVIGGLLIIFITLFVLYPEKINKINKDVKVRLELYLVEGNSARSDSYRVMFREIGKGNMLGYGIGTFGGPASTKYDSPYYKEFGFNWYGMEWADLATTDTYPPHPFVEFGLIGGLLYFLLILSPLIKRKVSITVLIIYFTLFVDMLFTFSLNNLEYLMFSLVFVYPLYYFGKKIDNN